MSEIAGPIRDMSSYDGFGRFAREVLEAAGVRRARILVTGTGNERMNVRIAS